MPNLQSRKYFRILQVIHQGTAERLQVGREVEIQLPPICKVQADKTAADSPRICKFKGDFWHSPKLFFPARIVKSCESLTDNFPATIPKGQI